MLGLLTFLHQASVKFGTVIPLPFYIFFYIETINLCIVIFLWLTGSQECLWHVSHKRNSSPEGLQPQNISSGSTYVSMLKCLYKYDRNKTYISYFFLIGCVKHYWKSRMFHLLKGTQKSVLVDSSCYNLT